MFCEARYLKDTKNCSLFQVFKYSQELFAAFSGLLVRMYLHCTFRNLSKLFCSISLADEKKVTEIIVKHCRIFFDKFWHATNYQFFFQFFDRFDEVNSSVRFNNLVSKLQFGPYNFGDYIHFTVEFH